MALTEFFGNSIALIIATLFLIAFILLGAFDGLYFHVFKFKLHRLPEAQLEHQLHAARGVLFVPIAAILFAVNSGGWLLWTGLFLLLVDLGLELFDILVEKSARRFIGGISSAESAIHVMATSARVVAITLILNAKPISAYGLDSPIILPDAYPPFLAWIGAAFAIGSALGTISQLTTMLVIKVTKANEKVRGFSNEGIHLDEYHLPSIYLGIPFAVALEGFLRLIRPSIKEKVIGAELPQNAIVYSFHRDAMLTLSTRSVIDTPNVAFIAFHGLASYFPTLHYTRQGVKAIRYKRNTQEKPKEQIIRELKSHKGPVFIRTDSGQPYGKVRASLIDLAAATGRPLVPMVQKASRFVTIAQHIVPMPRSLVTSYIGEPISSSEITSLSRQAACALLQERIDTLASDEPKTFAPRVTAPGGHSL